MGVWSGFCGGEGVVLDEFAEEGEGETGVVEGAVGLGGEVEVGGEGGEAVVGEGAKFAAGEGEEVGGGVGGRGESMAAAGGLEEW